MPKSPDSRKGSLARNLNFLLSADQQQDLDIDVVESVSEDVSQASVAN
jgi:hypothetical protein